MFLFIDTGKSLWISSNSPLVLISSVSGGVYYCRNSTAYGFMLHLVTTIIRLSHISSVKLS